MGPAIASAASALGGINRIVLGHSHVDHRGAAPELRAPVFCHADDRAQAEGDGGLDYVDFDKLRAYARPFYRRILRVWDGGPVTIAGTIAEGDDVSGFRAVHIPGHSPGMIALFRERDGLMLSTDLVYTLDVQTGPPSPPHAPARRVQPRLGAGARLGAQGGGDRARRDVARARRAASPATSPRSWRRSEAMGKRSRRRGQEAMPDAPEVAVHLARGRRADAARRDDGRHAAGVRGAGRDRGGDAARTPGSAGSSSSSSASPCAGSSRAPSRSLRQKELLGRYRFATADERRWIRDVLREHLAEWFPDLEAAVSIDAAGFARLLTDYCLEVQPGQQVVVRSTTLAAPLLLALQAEILGRGAWPLLRPALPGEGEGWWAAARDEHLDGFAPADLREAEETDASVDDPGAGEHDGAGRRRPRADGPRGPRPGADPRGGDAPALVLAPTGRRRPPPSRRAWARPSSRPS